MANYAVMLLPLICSLLSPVLPRERIGRISLTNFEKYVAKGSEMNFTCEVTNFIVIKMKVIFHSEATKTGIQILDTDVDGKYMLNSMLYKVEPAYLQKTGSNKVSLSVRSRSVNEASTGWYICEAEIDTNSDGKTDERHQNMQKIFVGNPPSSLKISSKVLWHPGKNFFEKNDVINIACTADIDRPNGTLKFYINNREDSQLIKSIINNKYKVIKSLYLSKPQKHDGAIIRCVASNPYGSSSKRIFLRIKYTTTSELITINGKNDSNVETTIDDELICNAMGNPKPKTKWLPPNPRYFEIVRGYPNRIRSIVNSGKTGVQVTCEAVQENTNTRVKKVFNVIIKQNITLLTKDEAEINGSAKPFADVSACYHYRVLVLCAAALFIFSFTINQFFSSGKCFFMNNIIMSYTSRLVNKHDNYVKTLICSWYLMIIVLNISILATLFLRHMEVILLNCISILICIQSFMLQYRLWKAKLTEINYRTHTEHFLQRLPCDVERECEKEI